MSGIDAGTPLNLDVSGALSALDKVGAADEALRRQQLQSNALVTQSFASVAASVQQYENKLGAIVTESQAGAAAQRQFAGEIAGLVREIRDQTAAQREAQRAAAAAGAERRKASQEAREAARTEKAAAKEAAAAAKEVAAAERLRAKEAAAANAESAKGGGILGGVGKVLGSLQGQVVAAFGVAAIKAFFSEVKDNAIATESTLGKLTFANGGNAQAAARDYAFVRFQVDRLGLDLNTTGKSYGSFTAAAEAANFPLAEARRLFLATAGASATLKLSADDTQGVLLAFTQILSKGTVQAEELRGQIGERLPGAFAIAARSMGVTEQQLNKLLQTGQVKAADFLPKFAEELQKTFGDGTAQAFDSAIANQNRFENEYNAFLLRFQGATAAATSKAAEYFRRFNEGLDLKSIGGRERLGEKAAQPGIQAYEAVLNGIVAQAEKDAKKSGEDITFRIGFVLAEQRNLLDRQREEAIKALAFFDTNTKEGNENAGSFRGGLIAFRQAEVQARARVKLLDGEIAKLGEVAEARKKADMPTDIEGLVKRQQDIIKALKARQLVATQENKGNGQDFLLGAGGLDEQLKAAEKELDRLLGKVDKAAKAAADRLAAALRALATARADLANKASQAVIKDSDDASLRAKLTFEEALRQSQLIEQKLKEREAAVRKAGGRGEKADGVIDGAQEKALSQLRIRALDDYYEALLKITLAREQRLFDLRRDDDQKEIDAVSRKYDALIKVNTDGIERQAIEEARQRALLAVKAEQEQRRITQTASLATNAATAVGQNFGTGTGISVIEAKRAEQQALLDIERKAAEDSLNNTLNKTGKEAEIERQALRAQLARLGQQQKELNRVKSQTPAEDLFYKAIFGEEDSTENRDKLGAIVGQFKDALAQTAQAAVQAADAKVDAYDRSISELSASLAAEIQLNESGAASNIRGILDQIAEEKEARKQALAEKKRAQEQEAIINQAQQASALLTAAANLILGWSELPLVGQVLGALSVAAMLASFLSTRATVASATAGSFYVGGFTGEGDPRQESRAVGPRSYVYHKAEFVMPHDLTAQYRLPLFEPLHKGRPEDIDWSHPSMRALMPDLGLPDQLAADKRAYVEHHIKMGSGAVEAKLDAVTAELAEIKATNYQMANEDKLIDLGGGRIMRVTPNGSQYITNA